MSSNSRKIFVSYKYSDNDVAPLWGYHNGTARDYVSYLQDHKYSGDDINAAENDGEDLSNLSDKEIKSKLSDKMWGSSITLVLISPNMVNKAQAERNQWIPWEVSYSLRVEPRANGSSQPNGMVAIVLPDSSGSYDYFMSDGTLRDWGGKAHIVTKVRTGQTFDIIGENMFNSLKPYALSLQGQTVYVGESSYIIPAYWEDFKKYPDWYLNRATDLRHKTDQYDLHKQLHWIKENLWRDMLKTKDSI